jgi:voltage-gated potassium channel
VAGAVEVADSRLEEIDVSPACQGVGRRIEEVRGDAVVVAVRRADGRVEPQPDPQSRIEAGDMLVALGSPAALERLEMLFEPVAVSSS